MDLKRNEIKLIKMLDEIFRQNNTYTYVLFKATGIYNS